MATSRPFSYNTGGLISGTEQVGNIAAGSPLVGFETTGLEWWNGPDEELGYVICLPVPGETQDSPVKMTWDPNYVGAGNTLSNENMTLSSTGFSSVLAETKIFTNSMFSVQINQDVNSSYIGIGKLDMNISGYVGGVDGKSLGFGSDGNLYFGGSNINTGFDPWGDVNDVIDVAIDYINSSIWIRVNGGSWNNNPSANPSLNTGGFSIPLLLPNTYPAITIYSNSGTPQVSLLDTPLYPVPSEFYFLKNCGAVGFIISDDLTDESFKNLVNSYFNQNFLTPNACKSWLTTNGYWTSWGSLPPGMVLYLDAGLTSSYPGSGSTWYDLSGNNNNGTINGAAYSSSQGGVFEFDGINDNISFSSVNNIPIGNEPYTISVWFKSDEMPSDRGFVGWGEFGLTNQVNAWRLRNNGGSSGFRHYWWGNDLDYNTPMNTTTWYNAVAAYENGTRNLYLNNVLVASDTPTGHNVQSAANLRIGVTAESLNEWFDGQIGQVVIYKRQATVAEVSAIYNSGVERFV